MYDSACSFLAKLNLWETHLAVNNLAHFPTLKSVFRNETDGLIYIPKTVELKIGFQKRFFDFKHYKNELRLFCSSFAINIGSVNEELQMWVIELQCKTVLKTKYDTGMEFYESLSKSYPRCRNHCAKILSMFGSTNVCEQLFSVKKLSKTKFWSQLKDTRLNSVLRIATGNMWPDIDILVQKKKDVWFLVPSQSNNRLWKKNLIIKDFYFLMFIFKFYLWNIQNYKFYMLYAYTVVQLKK